MKDRVPTQIVNGAVRMEQLDADGNSLGYIYLRRADDPTEPGTPYNKNSVLTDDTAESLGLDTESNPTPNDAFFLIGERLLSSGNLEIFDIPSLAVNKSHVVDLGKPLSNAACVWCGALTPLPQWNITGAFSTISYGYAVTDNALLNADFLRGSVSPVLIDTKTIKSITFENNTSGTKDAFKMYVLWRP